MEPIYMLTDRQAEVLTRVAAGWTNAEVAKQLGISVQTVKNHMQVVFFKLGAQDRAQAAMIAVLCRLISVADVVEHLKEPLPMELRADPCRTPGIPKAGALIELPTIEVVAIERNRHAQSICIGVVH